jgi:tryptamine 5-hydroxylase
MCCGSQDVFVGGTDATFTTPERVMAELVRHPRALKKAQDEVRRVVGSKGLVEESDLGELHYMRAVIKETLRLHPPVPLLVQRESVAPSTLGGYDIPARTRVLINAFAMGRDPEVWENPLRYSPERFENGGGSDIDFKDADYKMLPFGGGRRGCPGYTFAMATVQLSLASLLYHFEWALPAGVSAMDVNLDESFGLTTRKKEPLLAVVRKNDGYEFKGEELNAV